jgi:hypothetical protein
MIATCCRCGCCWETSQEQASTPNAVCSPCYWDLRPGDGVVFVEEMGGHCQPRKGGLYTVQSIERLNCICLIFLYGFQFGYPPSSIRFIGRPILN